MNNAKNWKKYVLKVLKVDYMLSKTAAPAATEVYLVLIFKYL